MYLLWFGTSFGGISARFKVEAAKGGGSSCDEVVGGSRGLRRGARLRIDGHLGARAGRGAVIGRGGN